MVTEYETRLQQHPFYHYTAKYWVHPYYAASADLDQLTLALLENKAKVSALYQAMQADPGYSPKFQCTLPDSWIPNGSADFSRLFMLHLMQRWLKLCDIRDRYLTESVFSYLDYP
jgi:hypothetical protein